TALVSGSTQGIGRAAAIQLAEMGARLILLARNAEKLKEVVIELKSISDLDHRFYVADFSNPEEVKEAITTVAAECGAIEILVNNTGGPPGGKAIDADVDEYRSAFEMHLVCNQLLVQGLVEGMKEKGYGRIVNVISTSVKQPLQNLGVSNTIRGAVANWAKTLSLELGEFGITVNNVLPGATATGRLDAIAERKSEATGKTVGDVLKSMGDAVPMRRVAQPAEVANGICFLASPAASYINGINLPVDGGRTGSL
ncbi:MAG TPA: SDR family oxidoreductase, partial [Cryomorphaceae bacterium]|nr:SDR family oxidoreductase [Cryomorphaceae bacterium]